MPLFWSFSVLRSASNSDNKNSFDESVVWLKVRNQLFIFCKNLVGVSRAVEFNHEIIDVREFTNGIPDSPTIYCSTIKIRFQNIESDS